MATMQSMNSPESRQRELALKLKEESDALIAKLERLVRLVREEVKAESESLGQKFEKMKLDIQEEIRKLSRGHQ